MSAYMSSFYVKFLTSKNFCWGYCMHSIRTFCIFTLIAMSVAGFVAPGSVSAIEPAVVETAPLPGAVVTVIGNNGTINVSVAELEAIGLKRITTGSPWEKGRLVFEGILFRDFLKKVGLDDAEAVLVRAKDNYTQTIPREDWTNGPLLLATRQDGKPLTLRMQGPVRLVYPLFDHPAYDTEVHKSRWIWAITSIEHAQ